MNRLNRRELLRLGGAGAGLLNLPQSVRSSSPPGPQRPNVLFIFTDQQHAGMMSARAIPTVRRQRWTVWPRLARVSSGPTAPTRSACPRASA